MPGERLSMRKIREVLRLRFAHGLSQRAIGQSLRLSAGAVNRLSQPARRAGLGWPLPDELDDAQLETLLYPPPPAVASGATAGAGLGGGAPRVATAERDAGAAVGRIPRRCRRPGRLRLLLVLRSLSGMGRPAEADAAPGAHRRRAGVRRLRRSHHGGDRRGDRRGAPGRDLRRACWAPPATPYARSGLERSRCRTGLPRTSRMLAFIGGVPRQIVSDNLRAGITRACFYEPLVNRTYADMAAHYGTAVIPARPYKPRDKAKVEVGVQVVQRWILARLRNRRFFSLAELNQAIRELASPVDLERRIRSIMNTGSGDHERDFGRRGGAVAADSLQPEVVPILC